MRLVSFSVSNGASPYPNDGEEKVAISHHMIIMLCDPKGKRERQKLVSVGTFISKYAVVENHATQLWLPKLFIRAFPAQFVLICTSYHKFWFCLVVSCKCICACPPPQTEKLHKQTK